MSQAVRRRGFLAESGRAALAATLLPTLGPRWAELTSPGSTTGTSGEGLIAELEAQIPQLMAEAVVPGLSIALVSDARVVWSRGFGFANSASKAPVDTETVFRAESMSKPVFAYEVLRLCEKGVLDLDTPLTRYTTERVVEGDPRLDLITARHVLCHTGGFQNWRSATEPLAIHFDPGGKWLYSGEGYAYLQSVVTHLVGHVDVNSCGTYEGDLRVCATDIDDYMRTNLFVPFGMSSSGYVWNAEFEAHAAWPHDSRGAPFPTLRRPTAVDAARYASSGGLLTTPVDYAKFLIEVIDPRPSDAFRLTRRSLDEMVRPRARVSEGPHARSWALGWEVFHEDSGDVIAHGGDNPGTHSYAAASVGRKAAFVIMTNGDMGSKVIGKLAGGEAMSRLLGG